MTPMDPVEAFWDHVERARNMVRALGDAEREVVSLDTRASAAHLSQQETVKLCDLLWAQKARVDLLKAHAEREARALATFQQKYWGFTFEGQRPYGQARTYPDDWTVA